MHESAFRGGLWALTAAALVAVTPPAPAQPSDASATPATEEEERPPVTAELLSERGALVAGRVNILGVLFDIEEGWHIYWPGLNDTGLPTVLELDAPEGFQAKDPVFPAPHRHTSPGDLLDHIFEGPTVVILPVFVPPDASGEEPVTIRASAEWLMCREFCMPGAAEDLEITLPIVTSPADAPRNDNWPAFRETRKRTPRPIGAALGTITTVVERSGDGAAVTFVGKGVRKLAFYPAADSAEVEDLLHAGEKAGDGMELTVKEVTEENGALKGVLEVWGPGTQPPSRVYRIDIPLHEPAGQTESGADAPDADS